jgi:hypothetical protein
VVHPALEEVDLPPLPVVHPQEPVAARHRPGDGIALQPEVPLHVVQELQRLHPRAVALVDEGEDRGAAPVADLEELARALLDATAVVE